MKSLHKYILNLVFISACALVISPAHAQDPPQKSPVPIPFDPSQAASASNSAQASSNTPISADALKRAETLLSGYHGLPPRDVFIKEFSNPKIVLKMLAIDPNTPPLQRRRALEGLGYFAAPDVESLYVKLLENKQTPELVRHRLISLLAQHFPTSALQYTRPFLTHADLQFRLSAIDAIRRIPGDAARRALEKAAKSETHAVAQRRLAAYTRFAR